MSLIGPLNQVSTAFEPHSSSTKQINTVSAIFESIKTDSLSCFLEKMEGNLSYKKILVQDHHRAEFKKTANHRRDIIQLISWYDDPTYKRKVQLEIEVEEGKFDNLVELALLDPHGIAARILRPSNPLLDKPEEAQKNTGIFIQLLERAIEGDCVKQVKKLLEYRPDMVNHTIGYKNLLTIASLDNRNPELVNLLLTKGAYSNPLVSNNRYLIDECISYLNPTLEPIVTLLIAKGAYPTGRDSIEDLRFIKGLDATTISFMIDELLDIEANLETREINEMRDRIQRCQDHLQATQIWVQNRFNDRTYKKNLPKVLVLATLFRVPNIPRIDQMQFADPVTAAKQIRSFLQGIRKVPLSEEQKLTLRNLPCLRLHQIPPFLRTAHSIYDKKTGDITVIIGTRQYFISPEIKDFLATILPLKQEGNLYSLPFSKETDFLRQMGYNEWLVDSEWTDSTIQAPPYTYESLPKNVFLRASGEEKVIAQCIEDEVSTCQNVTASRSITYPEPGIMEKRKRTPREDLGIIRTTITRYSYPAIPVNRMLLCAGTTFQDLMEDFPQDKVFQVSASTALLKRMEEFIRTGVIPFTLSLRDREELKLLLDFWGFSVE